MMRSASLARGNKRTATTLTPHEGENSFEVDQVRSPHQTIAGMLRKTRLRQQQKIVRLVPGDVAPLHEAEDAAAGSARSLPHAQQSGAQATSLPCQPASQARQHQDNRERREKGFDLQHAWPHPEKAVSKLVNVR